jgi:hypothetical protein
MLEEKPVPVSATLPNTNLTWTGVGLNLILRALRLMMDRMGQGTVAVWVLCALFS